MKRLSRYLRAAIRLPRQLALAPLKLYRRLISPARAPRCKYHPSCSAYAEQAISELGLIKGSIVAGWRLLRCNPFSYGGVDDLCDRSLFRAADRPDPPNETPVKEARA